MTARWLLRRAPAAAEAAATDRGSPTCRAPTCTVRRWLAGRRPPRNQTRPPTPRPCAGTPAASTSRNRARRPDGAEPRRCPRTGPSCTTRSSRHLATAAALAAPRGAAPAARHQLPAARSHPQRRADAVCARSDVPDAARVGRGSCGAPTSSWRPARRSHVGRQRGRRRSGAVTRTPSPHREASAVLCPAGGASRRASTATGARRRRSPSARPRTGRGPSAPTGTPRRVGSRRALTSRGTPGSCARPRPRREPRCGRRSCG